MVQYTAAPSGAAGGDLAGTYPNPVVAQSSEYFEMTAGGQSNTDFTCFAGDAKALTIGSAGGGVAVKEGANARSGVATLVTGAAVVANTSVTATTRIQLTVQSLGTVTAPKALGVTARTAGTSFTITSADATDTSVVAWFLVEPA
jgi:hypothetical protein